MWYNKVVKDLDNLPDFIDHFNDQLNYAKKECALKGHLEKQIAALPGITEYRYNQLQEIEALLEYMEIQLRRVKQKHYKIFLEGYNKTLSSADAKKYSEADQEVVDYEVLKNEVALLRNRYLGIMKAIESKNFMLGHITRIRSAGLEDIHI